MMSFEEYIESLCVALTNYEEENRLYEGCSKEEELEVRRKIAEHFEQGENDAISI